MGGVAVGALASHLCGPCLDSWTGGHMLVELFVGSLPCFDGFSPGSPVFLPSQKSTLLNPTSIQWMKSHSVEVPLQIAIYFIYCYYLKRKAAWSLVYRLLFHKYLSLIKGRSFTKSLESLISRCLIIIFLLLFTYR
jgi:hypothetical protein